MVTRHLFWFTVCFTFRTWSIWTLTVDKSVVSLPFWKPCRRRDAPRWNLKDASSAFKSGRQAAGSGSRSHVCPWQATQIHPALKLSFFSPGSSLVNPITWGHWQGFQQKALISPYFAWGNGLVSRNSPVTLSPLCPGGTGLHKKILYLNYPNLHHCFLGERSSIGRTWWVGY